MGKSDNTRCIPGRWKGNKFIRKIIKCRCLRGYFVVGRYLMPGRVECKDYSSLFLHYITQLVIKALLCEKNWKWRKWCIFVFFYCRWSFSLVHLEFRKDSFCSHSIKKNLISLEMMVDSTFLRMKNHSFWAILLSFYCLSPGTWYDILDCVLWSKQCRLDYRWRKAAPIAIWTYRRWRYGWRE